MKKNHHYTIIEIIITISVSGILASGLYVTSEKVRAKSDIVHCASNMHQLGRSYYTYASSNSWQFPPLAWVANTENSSPALVSSKVPGIGEPGTSDFVQGGAYMPSEILSINLCPADDNPDYRDYIDQNGVLRSDIPSSYGYNLTVMMEKWSLDQISNPNELLLSYDAAGLGTAGQEEGSTDSTEDSGSSTDEKNKEEQSNNGHGNNADGVDSSNEGQGQGGPNGQEDTSYDEYGNLIDDENKGGGSTSTSEITEEEWATYFDLVLSDSRDWQTTVHDNLSKRHLNDANYLFFDGSVRYGEEITDANLSPGDLFPGEDTEGN